MFLFFCRLFIFTCIILNVAQAQKPEKPNAAEIHNQIKKLNFLGSVLYIAAHPDDENTKLISYFSNHIHARTGYLSLTRGDGGQNLIGPELRELLGVIRTQELIEARKIDGGEQYFTRANDFGYSKLPTETLQIWQKDQVLSDVIWTIRKFRPDIIINRFDNRTAGSTHGHHTASAMLSVESFSLAADPKAFPDQLAFVAPHQPKRIFFNTSFWFYGGKDKFEKADKSKLQNLETGIYYKTLGKSNQEIAALSRSRHQSQGFGTSGSRGSEREFLEFLSGMPLTQKENLFEGIDTSWNRIEGGKEIGKVLLSVEKNFNFQNPEASVPELVKAYQMIQQIKDVYWRDFKSEEIKEIIASCSGLFLEATSANPDATPGTVLQCSVEAINRSNVPITIVSAKSNFEKILLENLPLKNNVAEQKQTEIALPQNLALTQPYWLREKASSGMYTVSNQQNIGIPDVIRELKVDFQLLINGVVIPFQRDIVYKYTDDVKGEVYEPLDIFPDVALRFSDKVTIFGTSNSKSVAVKVCAGRENVSGDIRLELPQGWTSNPKSIPFKLAKKGSEAEVNFTISAPQASGEATAKAIATIDGTRFSQEQIYIKYNHIAKQQVLKDAEARFINPDIKTGSERIGYIMGAGDQVDKSLIQLGYDVTVLKPQEITAEKLVTFDVIITGIRAYNTIKELAVIQPLLLEFVNRGNTMIVQYNTLDDLVTKDMSPFPLKLSRDRVTEEDAEVRFLDPTNPILNYPNRITPNDFKGWQQEQGLYYPNEWDKAFIPLISSNDTGESPKNGALLVAKYGKGHYIYTGLSFFRELPEGVPGAFRLMANLISFNAKKQK